MNPHVEKAEDGATKGAPCRVQEGCRHQSMMMLLNEGVCGTHGADGRVQGQKNQGQEADGQVKGMQSGRLRIGPAVTECSRYADYYYARMSAAT